VSVAIVVVVITATSTLDAFSSSIVPIILVNGTIYATMMNFWLVLTTKVEMPYIEGVFTSCIVSCPCEYRA
jgi:hypothetical protein